MLGGWLNRWSAVSSLAAVRVVVGAGWWWTLWNSLTMIFWWLDRWGGILGAADVRVVVLAWSWK
jgi:hypothetical protein